MVQQRNTHTHTHTRANITKQSSTKMLVRRHCTQFVRSVTANSAASRRAVSLGSSKFVAPVSGNNYFSTSTAASTPSGPVSLPSQANVVIIGGGIIGNSIAYHLAKAGVSDVVLLEQHQITAGTTWHAAGLMVTFGSLSETSTEIRKYTKNLYSTLEEETGHSTGFKPCGFIEVASEADRVEEYRRIAAFNRFCGVDVQEISPDEIKRLFPLCKTDDIYSGFYVKTDGRVNPVDACVALNKGAKMHGAKVYEGVSVAGVETVHDASRMSRVVTGVKTTNGQVIKAKHVVNCSGMWARQLGEINGVNIPNQAAEHYYLITDAIPGVDPNWPVVEDPAAYTYIRPEGAGLMVGLFEGQAAAWNVPKIPTDFSFGEIEPDWRRYEI
jgi:glycine/D-amino acid oxidase-like deaminating enzyme